MSRSQRNSGRGWWDWLVVAAILLLAGGAAWGQSEYDLTVLVFSPLQGPTQLALSYPSVVDHDGLSSGIEQLARSTGALLGDVEIVDLQRARGAPEQGTAAEFSVTGLIHQASGSLPVGPLIRALPNWHHLRLVFIMPEEFTFVGPRNTVADGFAVQLVNDMQAYEYDVERKSVGSGPSAQATEARRTRSPVLSVVLIGLPAGFLVGWLLGDRRTGSTTAARR
ncbi:MAG: hypothetical protein JXA57_06705 [Armatimonadetes bacterium]|nr:hypothetical protein [Armatimonadota bacterium]